MNGILTGTRHVRAGAMIALAYLFILQGLLAPFVALAAPARLDPTLAVLCIEGTDFAGAQHGGPASHHGDDGCCDIGCLPHAGSAGSPAVGLSSPGFVPPTLRLAIHSPGISPDAPVASVRPPGSQGPRAPPSSVA